MVNLFHTKTANCEIALETVKKPFNNLILLNENSEFTLVEPKDMKAVLGLIQELADFEKEPDAVVITEDDLKIMPLVNVQNLNALLLRKKVK